MDVLPGSWGEVIFPQLVAKAIIIFCCFPVHECAHARMASMLGDPTGERAGRITLNPFKHLDLLGTMMLLAFGVGNAKPVPVNTYNLRIPKRDYAIVSLAGPMANLIMAVVLLFASHVTILLVGDGAGGDKLSDYIIFCLKYAAYINFSLSFFNLIPLPPTDGYHMLMAFVPHRFYHSIARMEKITMYIMPGLLLVFAFFGLSPVTAFTQWLYHSVDELYEFLFWL